MKLSLQDRTILQGEKLQRWCKGVLKDYGLPNFITCFSVRIMSRLILSGAITAGLFGAGYVLFSVVNDQNAQTIR